MTRFLPKFDHFESRLLPSLVFVFNGNSFARSWPDATHTQLAALELMKHGDRAVQLATPAMSSSADFDRLAASIFAISKGRPIGLMGFSAGGTIAMRMSQVPKLNVKAVMNYYGPPDLRDWLNYHRGDRFYTRVLNEVTFTRGIIALLSGPSKSSAFIVNAFGQNDRNIVSSLSTASFHRDFQRGQVFTYPGPHGVTLYADLAAFREFLSHLP
jgi:hypothetical protein